VARLHLLPPALGSPSAMPADATCSFHCLFPCHISQVSENLELRSKYPNEPMKFLDIEVDMLSIVRSLGQVGLQIHHCAAPFRKIMSME